MPGKVERQREICLSGTRCVDEIKKEMSMTL